MLTQRENKEATDNRTSRKRAIELFCKECIFDSHAAGTWREQVADCPAKNCPLFHFRPRARPRAA